MISDSIEKGTDNATEAIVVEHARLDDSLVFTTIEERFVGWSSNHLEGWLHTECGNVGEHECEDVLGSLIVDLVFLCVSAANSLLFDFLGVMAVQLLNLIFFAALRLCG